MSLQNILNCREDLSDYVFHFTKGKNAKEILKKIIEERKVVDMRNRGYICFSETPLTMVASMFNYFNQWEEPMYAPYGIGIRKEYLHGLGGRQVVYYDPNDKICIPEGDRWRWVRYEPGEYDFTWLREWRFPHESLNLTFNNCFVVVKINSDLYELQNLLLELDDVDVDAQPEDGGVRIEYTGFFIRQFKAVSLEEVSNVSRMNKEQLRCALCGQGNQESYYLGSTYE